MKINWMNVAKGLALTATLALGVAEKVIAKKELDDTVAKKVADALANQMKES